MAFDIGSILFKLVGDSSGLTAELKKADKAIKDTTKEATKSGDSFSKVGSLIQGALIGIGFAAFQAAQTALTQFFEKGIEQAMEFEQAMLTLKAVTADTAGEFEDAQRIIEGTKGGLFSDDDIAKALAYAETVGLTAREFNELLPGLRGAALVMGTDLKEATQAVSLALETGNLRLLRRVGIVLKEADLNAQSVRLYGVLADRLSEASKEKLIYSLVTERLNGLSEVENQKLDTFTGTLRLSQVAVDDAGKSLGQFALIAAGGFVNFFRLVGWADQYAKNLAETKNEQEAFNRTIAWFKGEAQTIDLSPAQRELQEFSETMARLKNNMEDTTRLLQDLSGTKTQEEFDIRKKILEKEGEIFQLKREGVEITKEMSSQDVELATKLHDFKLGQVEKELQALRTQETEFSRIKELEKTKSEEAIQVAEKGQVSMDAWAKALNETTAQRTSQIEALRNAYKTNVEELVKSQPDLYKTASAWNTFAEAVERANAALGNPGGGGGAVPTPFPLSSRALGGAIPETGTYLLHKGETVVQSGSNGMGVTVVVQGSVVAERDLVQAVSDAVTRSVGGRWNIG